MKLPFPRIYVLGYVQRDQKVPSVFCSCTGDSWDFSLIPQLAEEKKLPDATGHLYGVGHLSGSPLKGIAATGRRRKGSRISLCPT